MDPRKLLHLATVIESGSLKKAARELHVSQPALSTSMDRFERALGDRLLDRSPTGVAPTPLGKRLYAHARLIRDEVERAEQRLKAPASEGDDVVAFGTLPSLSTSIVPAAVCRWRVAHPATTLRVTEKNQIELLLALLRGDLDFIIAQTEVFGFLEGMIQRVLFRDRLYVLARPGHPALDLANPSWEELASYPWVSQMVGRPRTLLETLFASKGLGLPPQLTECSSVAFIKAVLEGSDSLALLPASAVSEDVSRGAIVPLNLAEPLLNRDIAVLFRDGVKLTTASRELLSAIEAAGLRSSNEPELSLVDA